MTTANILFLALAVSGFALLFVTLFTAWLMVTVLGGRPRLVARPPIESPTRTTPVRKAA